MAVKEFDREKGDPKVTEVGGPPVLWHLTYSHYNEKARWALDYKGLPHVRRAGAAGRHQKVAQRLTGGWTFPVLEIDGEAIGDSTRIIGALEQRYPEPPLYPSDPQAKRRALYLEDFFDEEFGPHLRILAINTSLRSVEITLGTFLPDISGSRRFAARALFPLVRRKFVTALTINEDTVELAWKKLRAAGNRFREELQPSGYLVGDSFTVADLTLAALVAPAAAPEQWPYPQPQRRHPLFAELRDALAESGLLQWTQQMYALHRGRSAEIPR